MKHNSPKHNFMFTLLENIHGVSGENCPNPSERSLG